LGRAVQVAAGNDYSLALLASGSVVAWGRQIDGRTSVPPGLEGVVQVAAGRYHGLALLSNGTCVSWGDARNAPPPQRFAQVSASIGQSLGLRLDGGVEAWGPDAFAVPADVATPAPSPPAPPPASTEGSSAPIGAIVGGVVGGLAAVAGVAGAVVYARKRSQKPVPAPEKGDASAIGGDKGAGTHAKDDSGHPGDLTWGIPPSNGDSAAAYDSYRSAYPASDQTSPPQFQPALPKQAAPAARAWEAPIDAISGARPSFAPASSNAGSSTAFGSSPGSLQSGLGAETLAVPTIASNGGGRSPAVAASSTPAVSTEQQSIPSVPVVTEVARLGSDGAPAADAPHAQQQSKLLVPASDIEIDHSKSLGQGTFGAVYQGRLRGSVRVAVKTLKDTDAAAAAAFAREVRNWEGLVQRNVMPLMAYCLDPPMMVCEIADGGNMRQYLGRAGWDQGLGRKLLSEVAAGMTYLHSAHVLHGDLKSVNVLVDGGRALITDFGLSRVRADNAASATVGGLFGTPGFIAPELMNGKSLRAPADVYAFGMVCYEVVSKGLYPFHNVTNIMALMYQVGVENKRPERPAGVPEAMWALMQACWQPSPEERPKMEAVRDTLEDMV
ncbi:kinase-like domain-containing protein, partial [Hyaloraphidium curvatum]